MKNNHTLKDLVFNLTKLLSLYISLTDFGTFFLYLIKNLLVIILFNFITIWLNEILLLRNKSTNSSLAETSTVSKSELGFDILFSIFIEGNFFKFTSDKFKLFNIFKFIF